MNLRGRIPVEPLSDERMTNIERRIVASDAASSSSSTFFSRTTWPALAAAAVLVFAVGFVGWKIGRQHTTDTVAQSIRVDTRERTTIDIGDATLINDPNTQLVVTRPAGGVLVDMQRGKVELEVVKRTTKPPFIVRAGSTDVIVVGTHFSVDYGDGTGDAIVEVTEGTVKVVRHDESFVASVPAGNGWTHAGGVVTLAQLHTQIAAADQRAVPRFDSADMHVATPTGSTDVAIPTTVDTSMHDHTATTPTGTTPGEQVRTAGEGSGSAGEKSHGKIKVTAFKEDFHKSLLQMAIAPAYNNGISDLNDAINQHNKAAQQFGDNVAPELGESASQALYSIAVIQFVQLRDPVRALGTLDRYLDRFKHKGEHGDALWLRVRILCEKRFDEPCRHAAEVYAQEVPSGSKSGLALNITTSHEE
jgi:FecR protein